MKTSSKIVFFDNGCRVCRTGALLAGKAGMASGSELNELQTMSAEVSCDLDAVRYCNEIAVYDKETKESRYGIKGMVWFVEDKWGKWVNVFLLPPIYQILNFFYHIFSYNRKMIAPVYGKVENDCEPEFHWGYRLAYVFIAIVFALLTLQWELVVRLLVAPVVFFAFSSILAVIPNKMEYVGHLTSIFIQQVLRVAFLYFVLGLLIYFAELGTYLLVPFVVVFVLFFYGFTFYFHARRIMYLKMNDIFSYFFMFLTILVHMLYFFL